MMIPLLNTKHFYADLYASVTFWTIGLAFDKTECGCVRNLEFHIPFLILQVGHIRDEEWDDEAVYEPAQYCDPCDSALEADGRCDVCGWGGKI